MNRRELEGAISDEVAEWPGVTVEFVHGGKHPKAKLTYAPEGGQPLMLARAYGGNQDHIAFPHKMIADMRRVMQQLGATRTAPPPTEDETERRYSKPNDGAAKRPDPVEHEKAEPKPDIGDQLVQAGAVTREDADAALAPVERRTAGMADPQPGAGSETADQEADEELARFHALVESIEDGIYFALPADVYHAVPRLSNSALVKVAVSPATFWRDSWLDPNPTVLTEEQAKKKFEARRIGQAYHTARLEPHLFERDYVRELDKRDFPQKGLLTSDEKVKAQLKARSIQQTVSGETTAERAQRLLDDGYEGVIWPLEVARWEAEIATRVPRPTPLSAKVWDDITLDMERMRGNAEVHDLLTGGEAEVSIFWTDDHGLKMKARIDYLKLDAWKDFKTFANPNGKELEQAIADAIRYNRYHMQAVGYRDAVEAIRTGGLQIRGEATGAQRTLVAAIQMRPGELACWYIFQEKGGVPNLLAYEFDFFDLPMTTRFNSAGATDDEQAAHESATRRRSQLHVRGRMDIEAAKRAFVLHSQVYKPGEPWAPLNPRRSFADLIFNQHWLEGRV